MPFERFSLDDTSRWDKGDWYNASACTNMTAALQIVASAGAGNYHYISSIHVSSPSAQLFTITDGTSATITQFYSQALTPLEIQFPRGMERRCPNVGQNIKMKSDVSASVYYTIAGFYYPWIAT